MIALKRPRGVVGLSEDGAIASFDTSDPFPTNPIDERADERDIAAALRETLEGRRYE